MKKNLLVLPLLALMASGTLISCGDNKGGGDTPTPYVPCQHVDGNHDGKCDKCGQGGMAIKHTDANSDYKCDVCGQIVDHTCVDLDENGKCDICEKEVPIPIKEPETFAGFRRVLQPENGKQYLLGMVQPETAKMIFFNGSPHRDQAGDYPFYLGCNTFNYTGDPNKSAEENDVDIETDAVKVQVDYVGESTELFTIKFVDGTGKETPQYYHGYLQVYGDYNKNCKTSLRFDTDKDSTYKAWTDDDMKEKASCTEHKDANSDGNCDVCGALISAEAHDCVDADENNLCDVCNKTYVADAPAASQFRVIKDYTYNGATKKNKNVIVADFNNKCDAKNPTRTEPVALGTWSTYNNVEALTADNILDGYVAHFWEKIPVEA